MQKDLVKEIHAESWVYLFIFTHLFVWSLIPALVRFNLPLDAIEGTIWAQQLEWGYDKNPFLNGWLTAFANYLSNHTDWMLYCFSQLCVVTCFYATWALAKKLISPVYAMIAVMLLEVIQYFNFHAIDFNDNTLELALWALVTYFFYCALQSPKKWALWLATGFFAGLGMMAKYYTGVLLLTLFLFLCLPKDNRRYFRATGPYIAIITFILTILPHSIWLFFHDFVTVYYVLARVSSPDNVFNHVIFPLQFSVEQLVVFLPALIIFGCLILNGTEHQPKNKFDRMFLCYVALGPFLITVALSVLLGFKLRAGWGMPLLTLWSTLLLFFIRPRLSNIKMYSFLAAIFSLMAGMMAAYYFALTNSNTPTSANYPGQEIAQHITESWHKVFHTKLPYVCGPRWISGNIGFYSKDHPAIFAEWNERHAPWINERDIEQKGAVFIWTITDGERIPEKVLTRFPTLQKPIVQEFSWKRNKKQLQPIKLGIAILPPKSTVA